MPRLPAISKYWVSRGSGALASLNEYAMFTLSIGFCATPLTMIGSGRPATSSSIDRVMELMAKPAFALDAPGPVRDHPVARATPVRCDLLDPLIRRVHRMRPAHRVMVVAFDPPNLSRWARRTPATPGRLTRLTAPIRCIPRRVPSPDAPLSPIM
jgi:hypothetical protein